MKPPSGTILLTFVLVLAFALVGAAATFRIIQLPTTLDDFFQPGSQPNGEVVYEEFRSSDNCKLCHEFESPGGPLTVIQAAWQGSMMAQSARDPLFYACLAVANQDAAFAGDLCLRCHTPGGWLAGRSEPTDGSNLTAGDRDGVSCSVCHRMVDPVLRPTSPIPDAEILAAIDPLPISPGGGNFVMDPFDRRRGPYPFDCETELCPPHTFLESPFHTTSELCATCHDVSNPVYMRQQDGTYAATLEGLGQPHPTGDKYDMFPLERTYSEWLHSQFASEGVDMGGRFGGNLTVVNSCQDCHMPDTTGKGCALDGYPVRDDLASHALAGGNAWVQDMVLNLYPDDGLNAAYLAAGKAEAVSMLERACTLEVTQDHHRIDVRLTNETGHKLPTGYPEGRRMWINVEFRDEGLSLLEDRGHYDALSADLNTQDTKVYEIHLGIDAAIAALTGLPEGVGFHFALNNVVLKDNRIPPRGFTNAAYAAVQASPVGVSYVDGQYWDDTEYRLPAGAHQATVNVYYQTASKEFIAFLRDENVTNDAGETLYEQWELTGMSPPVLMATQTLVLDPYADGDYDGNAIVDLDDYFEWGSCQTGPGGAYADPACAVFDFDGDGDVDQGDFREFMLSFTG